MKKIIAALLVLTMVLALTGTAMAGCKIKAGDYVKFTKNATAYTAPRDSKKTSDPETIVSKGSIAFVVETKGDWVHLRLSHFAVIDSYVVLGWFKSDAVKVSAPNKITGDVLVRYSNGGNGYSKAIPGEIYRDYIDKDHVQATAKVWLHKEPSLSKSYGKALKKDQKVRYRHLIGFDDRGVGFYGVRYEGKCLWVSSLYSKLVK